MIVDKRGEGVDVKYCCEDLFENWNFFYIMRWGKIHSRKEGWNLRYCPFCGDRVRWAQDGWREVKE